MTERLPILPILPERTFKRRHLDPRQYTFRSAAESDVHELIREPCLIREGGRVSVVYLHLRALGINLDPLVEKLRAAWFPTWRRTSGMQSQSRVFGYEPRRTIRMKDFCSATRWATDAPDSHEAVCDGAQVAEAMYRRYNPTLFAKHQEIVANKVLAAYHLRNTVFTSGIVNKNNPLPYHFDKGNFASVWSAMLVFKGSGLEGGYLALPQYDAMFALPDHSLFMFDGQGLLHGVTPMKVPEDSYRFSIVYYSLHQMWRCETPEGELARIKKLKTKRERRRGGLRET